MGDWVLSGLDHEERPVVVIGNTVTMLVGDRIETWAMVHEDDRVIWADGSPRMVPDDYALYEIHTVANRRRAGEGNGDA